MNNFYSNYLKRIFDFLTSLFVIVTFWWVYVLIFILIKIDTKGNVFFTQKRIGKNKEIFGIYKFRTMRIDTPKDTPTHLLDNPDQWITTVGKILRKTSLDELPQIFNILVGEMSIVGPRPALWNQHDLIEERDKYGANNILPGLTGWAQVNGRDELPIEVKAKYDGEYVQSITLIKDIKCILMTISSVVLSKGIKEGK